MALQISYDLRATKELHRLPGRDKVRVYRRIRAYAENFSSAAHDVVPLTGALKGFRLRVGGWCVLFELTETTMHVERVLHRREAYR